jgi:predicted O-methyltransferase YrrM
MDIVDTRKCNLFNLEMLARYMEVPASVLIGYYEELLADDEFLSSVNRQIEEIRNKWDFRKAIFAMPTIPSVDWFAFERVLIYVLIRHLKPIQVLETGVYYGGNSAFALLALARNKCGKMISIDYPDSQIRMRGPSEARHSLVGDSEFYNPTLRPGFMVPPFLHGQWALIEGDSLKVIPDLQETFDFYIHDSDHSMPFLSKELAAAWNKLSDRALVLVDDIDWSNAFFAFCVKHRLFPLLMTDNGKDNLRVRTGIALRGHANNSNDLFT